MQTLHRGISFFFVPFHKPIIIRSSSLIIVLLLPREREIKEINKQIGKLVAEFLAAHFCPNTRQTVLQTLCGPILVFERSTARCSSIPCDSATTLSCRDRATFSHVPTSDALQFNHTLSPGGPLYDHLRHALATERLGTDKGLSLDTRQQVARCRGRQHDGLGDQGRRAGDDAEPLDEGHDAVRGGAHVIGRDFADIAIEGAGCRTDAQKEGDLDENDDESGCPVSIKGRMKRVVSGIIHVHASESEEYESGDSRDGLRYALPGNTWVWLGKEGEARRKRGQREGCVGLGLGWPEPTATERRR